jgi:hypothetical protein
MKIATHVLIALGLCLLSGNTLVLGQTCRSQNPNDYERDNYVVQSVSIESDETIFARAVTSVPGLISQLQVQAGRLFSKADLAASERAIIASSGYIDEPTIYVPSVKTIFDNCNAGARQVRVVFQVSYLSAPVKAASGVPTTYERFQAPSTPRTHRGSALGRLGSIFKLEPFVGFTGSENIAGAGLTVNPNNCVFQRLSAQGGGSASTALGSASLEGDRLFESAALRALTWRAGYEYSKFPSEDDLGLKKGTGFLQFFASSKSFGSQEFVLRYGASVEGGNRQTNLVDALVPAGDVASAGYKSIKTYIGASWRLGSHYFKSSYGLQAGGTNEQSVVADKPVDFLKHVFDAAYKVRFFPWDNKPLSLEAQFTAGRINRRGVLPVAEQFFGGNVDENFIAGSDWQIRTAPFIRSFSGKRLIVSDSLVPTGGEHFVSFNTTLSATFWSKPAIPKDARAEIPVAFDILENHPKAKFIRDALTTMFTVETKSYREQIATVDSAGIDNALLSLQQLLKSIPPAGLQPATRALRRKCLADIEVSLGLVKSFKEKIVFENGKFVTTNADARPELLELVSETMNEDTGAKDDGFLLLIVKRLTGMIDQHDPALDAVSPDLVRHRDSMQVLYDTNKLKFDTFERDGLPIAQTNAMNFIRDLHSQIDRIGRELNIVSVGPVFMFDAARLNTENQRSGFRYGVGAGLGVEFFGLQLTGGYSWNPNRRLGEPRGAAVFSFNVNELFR